MRLSICVSLTLGFSLLGSGCSFVFVKTASDPQVTEIESRETVPQQAAAPQLECTTGKAAPVVDTIIATLEAVRTVVALQAHNGDYAGAPINRSTDIGFGVGLTALFAVSAIYGFDRTNQCSELKTRLILRENRGTRSDALAVEDARASVLRAEAEAQRRSRLNDATSKHEGATPAGSATTGSAGELDRRLERARQRQNAAQVDVDDAASTTDDDVPSEPPANITVEQRLERARQRQKESAEGVDSPE